MVRRFVRAVVFLLEFALAIVLGTAGGIVCAVGFAALVYVVTLRGICSELRLEWRKRRLEAAVRRAA